MKQSSLETSFSETFTLYSDAIFRFCVWKVSQVELAEDMTQEVFARYWQYLRDGKEITNVRALLYTIAHNLAKDWYKKKKSVSLDEQIDAGHIPHDKTLSPETQAEYQEVLEVIHDLEETDKTVLLLTHVEGLPPKEIASMIGESANVVSVRLNRAMKRLQAKLGMYE